MSWLSENGLALFAPVTGMLVLVISYVGHRHRVNRDKIRLVVDFIPHPKQAENLKRLRREVNQEKPWDNPPPWHIVFFVVTVRNIGSVPAPLAEVGVYSSDRVKHPARIDPPGFDRLRSISEYGAEAIEPNSSRSFNVYLEHAEPEFGAVSAYAVDQTGTLWRSRRLWWSRA